MDKWLILELRHGIYKINLEYLIVPETKEFSKQNEEGMPKNREAS